MALSIRLLSDN